MKIEEKKTKTTEELENELESVTDSTQLENWIDQNQDQKLNFTEYFNELCEEKGVKISDIYMNSAIGKSFAYYMRNGTKLPSKETAIKAAFVLNATLEETNLLLKASGNKELYPRREEDAIIEFAIRNHLDVYQTEELLKKHGLKMSLLDKEKK
ncbi:hypothetical protein PND16_13270 [Blautia wexlerae]|uniref:hypothetical protein n=1 Tax=Blautia wexlerae TaxID=418240 RepID=UPI0018AB5509|nr:hypothetical protein [Blautia wexlerae]MDB6471157.1 hypothetical protein [Blautia wexlerae]